MKDDQPIKAIPTRYRGVEFRSRIEARWAVFFEELQLPWQYEPEGFALKSKNYLPDFYLPRQKLWVEVKPGNFEESATHLQELAMVHGDRVMLVKGSIPTFPSGDDFPENELRENWSEMFFPDGHSDEPYYWCRCQNCGEYGVSFTGLGNRIQCCRSNAISGRYQSSNEGSIRAAMNIARNRKFEHGTDQWQ